MVARTLGKQQTIMAIATKIALQMNCKMGGELWRVDMPVSAAGRGGEHEGLLAGAAFRGPPAGALPVTPHHAHRS